MADDSDKSAESAEKAYAEAAAKAKPAPAPEPAAVTPPPAPAPTPKPEAATPPPTPVAAKAAVSRTVPAPAPTVKKKIKKAPAKKVARKAQAAKPVVKPVKVPVRAAVAKPAPVAAPVPKPAPVAEPAPKTFAVTPTITELKEKIMATAKTPDFTQPMSDALGEIQTRAKVAYEKGTEAVAEMTEFTKGNVEAFVESGKILAGGVQDLGKTYVEEAKSAYETFTADIKEAAAIKSPTELFQLQGKIFRRNFDAMVATSSKNTEALVKLANDAFAPLSGRVDLAAEKLSKAA